MTATNTVDIPRGRPFTVEDLDAMPDDGNRYELIDGMLFVSPRPGRRHQTVLVKLAGLLDQNCPAGLEVLLGPFAVRPSDSTELRPDALVARTADLTEELLPTAPVLVVEILEQYTAVHDLNSKKAAYERMGVASYWVVDPLQPSLVVFEHQDGRLKQVAEATGEDGFAAERPFGLRVVPATLLR